MKRRELILAGMGVLFLAWGAMWLRAGRSLMSDVSVDAGPSCPAVPVLVLEPPGEALGSVVMFHGLGANRIVMLTSGQQFAAAGFRVFLPDAPGHGRNAAPFSFEASESCARGLLSSLERADQISRQRTVLFGHSLGAAIAIRLADEFPAAATIAVAAAPLVPPHRLPANLLLVAPQFDMPAVRANEARLATAAGSARTAPEDFRQLRAFELYTVPWRSHTGALFDSSATRAMVRWARESVGAPIVLIPARSYQGFAGGCLGLLGILFLFPAAASAITRLSRADSSPRTVARLRTSLPILAWMATLVPAAILSARWPFLSAIHLYSADYLASVLLLAGIPLAVVTVDQSRIHPSPRSSAQHASPLPYTHAILASICAAIVGLLFVATTGAWLNLGITEAWPTASRWARFPFLILALFPLSLAEERALGDPIAPGRFARAVRFALFLLLRGTVWLVMLGAWLSGVSSALLVTIFGAFLAVLSVAQRLGADAVHRRTGSAVASAIFNAILGAWFLAAAFPLA